MPVRKSIPMRKCTGCNEMKPKKELVRVVRSPEGEVSLDLTGKKPGRGAYVCRSSECLAKAIKAKRFEKEIVLMRDSLGCISKNGRRDEEWRMIRSCSLFSECAAERAS